VFAEPEFVNIREPMNDSKDAIPGLLKRFTNLGSGRKFKNYDYFSMITKLNPQNQKHLSRYCPAGTEVGQNWY
jgi:hypothetical protein